MTLERDIEVLRRVPLFADLPSEPLKLLAFSAEARYLGDRTTLFLQGDRADSSFVVVSGRIDLKRGTRLVASAPPGALIGEVALVIEAERPASAIAAGPSTVIEIRRQTFRRVLEEYPEVVRALQHRLAARLAALSPDLAAAANARGSREG
jgi:CRP-like cAMP-binding protein